MRPHQELTPCPHAPQDLLPRHLPLLRYFAEHLFPQTFWKSLGDRSFGFPEPLDEVAAPQRENAFVRSLSLFEIAARHNVPPPGAAHPSTARELVPVSLVPSRDDELPVAAHEKVKVIREQAPSVHVSPGLSHELAQARSRLLAIPIIPKDLAPLNPSCGHVVHQTRKVQTCMPQHARSVAKTGPAASTYYETTYLAPLEGDQEQDRQQNATDGQPGAAPGEPGAAPRDQDAGEGQHHQGHPVEVGRPGPGVFQAVQV